MNEKTYVFKSRRNRVWREGNTVYKQILPKAGENGPYQSAEFEANILKRLYNRGVYVPKIISCENNLLAMEYIESMTLTDYIELYEDQPFTDTIVERITSWFESFYNAIPLNSLRGDVNCRNFLVTPDLNIAGVDFETPCTGIRETDLGKLIAYILTYRPKYTAYKKYLAELLCRRFISRLGLDPAAIDHAKEQELKDIEDRRNNK